MLWELRQVRHKNSLSPVIISAFVHPCSPPAGTSQEGRPFPSVVSSALDVHLYLESSAWLQTGRKQRGGSKRDDILMPQLLIRNPLHYAWIVNELFAVKNLPLWVLAVCWTRPVKMLPSQSLYPGDQTNLLKPLLALLVIQEKQTRGVLCNSGCTGGILWRGDV